jgi:hypothetical protein
LRTKCQRRTNGPKRGREKAKKKERNRMMEKTAK